MQTGRVKFFNTGKGFGFIETSNGDIFFHHSGVPVRAGERVSLKDGQEVEFETRKGRKGLEAFNIVPAARIRRG